MNFSSRWKRSGFSRAPAVVLANSVKKVRALLQQGRGFDIGMLDLRLGDDDAKPLIDDLRRLGIPCLVATGFDDAVDLQGTVLIRKPYRDADIVCGAWRLLQPR
jgi:hypothetical protein